MSRSGNIFLFYDKKWLEFFFEKKWLELLPYDFVFEVG
jgi:hypothetical protein